MNYKFKSQKSKTFATFLAVLVLAGFVPLYYAEAYSIGVAVDPSELSINISGNAEATAILRVKNPSREVAIFEVYPENFEDSVVPIPGRFTLESSEERTVTIKVLPKQTGAFATNIAIVARPLSDPIIGVGSGIKIPLRVLIGESPKNNLFAMAATTAIPAIGIAVIAAVLGAGAAIFFRKKRV